MLARIRVESETKTNVEITAYEALVLDAKLFELKQLVDDQRRLIDFLRVSEKAKERALVAALRRFEPGPMGLLLVDMASVADRIERGEHRREED
jgi:hypothetical protein